MATARPRKYATINAFATVGENGALIPDCVLPLKPGERVALAISVDSGRNTTSFLDLVGTVIRYDNPFEPAVPEDDWEAGSVC